jgi:hypothetical protein
VAVEEAGALFVAQDDPHLAGMMFHTLQAFADDPDEHERWYRVGEENRRRTGNADHAVEMLGAYGPFVAHTYGDYPRALDLIDRAVALERVQSTNAYRLVSLLRSAAGVRLEAGDLETAAAHVTELLALWPPFRTLIPRGEAEALALAARVAWLRGDAAAAEVLMAPGSEAAGTLRGVLLRGELAMARGDLVSARGCADLALAMTAAPPVGRDGRLDRVRALGASADVAIAQREEALARRDLSEALTAVTSARFLPALLETCAVAAPLLPAEVAGAVLAGVVAHPATPFAMRRRLAGVAPDPGPIAAWDVAMAMAARVAEGVMRAADG